jgi:hypothetical protein
MTAPIAKRVLSKAQANAIGTIAWAQDNFGSFAPGRQIRRATVLKLVELGLAESVGMVAMCDDHGSLKQPERYREGFKLTGAGLAYAVDAVNSYHAKCVLARLRLAVERSERDG